MEIVILIISILALIPVAILVRDRYFKKKPLVSIDIENVFFASFDCPDHSLNGNLGLGFYNIKVVNISNSTFTIEDLALRYQALGRTYDCTSYALKTGKTPDQRPAVFLKHGNDGIVVMGWDNLRTEIGRHQPLTPGAIFTASAYFLLEHDIDIDGIGIAEFLLKDHGGTTSVHKLDIETARERSFRGVSSIMNTSFEANDVGHVEFV